MQCAYCGKKISVLGKLKGAEFCSPAHRKAYLKKQEDLALDFLLQNKQRPKAETSPQADPVESPESEPQPLLVAAEPIAERVPPTTMEATPERNTRPVAFSPHYTMPSGIRPNSPAARLAAFARLMVAAHTFAGQARMAVLGAVPFAGELPRIEGSALAPLWIEPVRQTREERPAAGWLSLKPRWVYGEAREVRVAALFRPTLRAAVREAVLSPCAPVLGVAPAASSQIEMNRIPAAAIGSHPAVRDGAAIHAIEPRIEIRPRACALPAPETISLALPPASSVSAANVSTECRSIRTELPAWIPAALRPGRPRLAHAVPAAVQFPQSISPKALIAAATPPFVWKWQVRVEPHTGAGAIRPLFDVPVRDDVDADAPVRAVEPVLSVPLATRLRRLIRAVPVWGRRLAVMVPVAAVLWTGIRRFDRSATAQNAQAEIWSRIRHRSAIEIQDDFRGGLSQWAGGTDWAKSWRYDGVGFARPGRLALLSRSLPLSNYRLEFTAQIERKAVGWVFRAADPSNYYATKLIAAKPGPSPALFIVRYTVIGGRERNRMQLPLPVTLPGRSLLHVRQEIRGAQFTTYLDGQIMDTWSDDRFASGGVGFFADAGESSYIRWIDVAQNDDALGLTCSYLASMHDR